MKVAFRVDASLKIGNGHVMRCLALAEALHKKGAESHFFCRSHPGNLFELIRQHGFRLSALPLSKEVYQPQVHLAEPLLTHAAWLACDWKVDADQMSAAFESESFDWLVVDHYGLDARWEAALKPHCHNLMVIDDLADRHHICDLLLDQTLGQNPDEYKDLVPANCKLFTGSNYALLRPGFATLRKYSLNRRVKPQLTHLLVALGGVDKDNATGKVLEVLKDSDLPSDCCINVVMGSTAPWLHSVRQQVARLSWPTEVMVNVSDMAQLMADSDLAIGTAGTSSWERCCLGLPAIIIVEAKNQTKIAKALHLCGAAQCVRFDEPKCFREQLLRVITEYSSKPVLMETMSKSAIGVTDGHGAMVLADYLLSKVV